MTASASANRAVEDADGDLVATVVVPARNERDAITACLASLQAQTERRLQIIVVDGMSDDGTRDIVRAIAADDPRVELHDNPGRTVPFGMNVALAAARATWLVRVDAHAAVPADYVARAVQLLESDDWGAVGGIKRGIGTTPAGKAIATAMASRFGVGGSVYHYGTTPQEVEHVPFGAYPVALARKIGGWGEEFTVNQDFEFDHRIRASGHRILFDPSLVIDWECRQSVRALYDQYHRYGKGKAKVALRHPDSVKPRHTLPPAFVAYGVVALAASVVRRRPSIAAVALSPYALALAGASVVEGRELDAPSRRFLPAAFAAMHVGWGIGFWKGLAHELRQPRA